MNHKNHTWRDNAAEFAALDRGEGWQFAILVACSVVKRDHGGDRRSSGDRDLKCSVAEFARLAGVDSTRIYRYYDAWQDAAAKGWVQDATTLAPADSHNLTVPDKPWRAKDGGVYDASKTGGQINNVEQIAAKAAKDPGYARRVLDQVSAVNAGVAQESVRDSVRRDPQIRGAAITGLDQADEDRAANRPVRPEKPQTARDEQGEVLDLIFNLRRAHRFLADAASKSQDLPAAVADKLTASIREEIDWIRGICDVIEVGLDGGSLDQQLRDLLDAEAGQ